MYFYQNSKYVKELNSKDFKINSLDQNLIPLDGEPVLVVFYAHWCPHCTNPTTLEFVETLGKNLPEKTKIKVAALSCEAVDYHRGIAYNVGVSGYPTFMYFNKKQKWNKYQGPMQMRPLLEFMLEKS